MAAVRLPTSYVTTSTYCNYSIHRPMVACGGLDKVCYVYDIDKMQGLYTDHSKQLVTALRGHTAYISAIKCISHNYRLLTSSGDSTVKLWDIVNSKAIRTLQSDTQSDITTMDLVYASPHSDHDNEVNTFITGSIDGYVRLFDLRQTKHVAKFAFINTDVDINIVKSFQNRSSFACGTEDGNIRFFDLRSLHTLNFYELDKHIVDETSLKHINGVCCIDFSKSGRFLFNVFEYRESNAFCAQTQTAWRVNNCVVRNTVTTEKVAELCCESPVTWLNVATNGKFVVTSHVDQTLRLWSPLKAENARFSDCCSCQ